jgi:hypothetical protein
MGLVGAALAFGAPVTRGVVDLLDGNAWLTNVSDGAVMLANGSSARVDLRMTIEGAAGHEFEVVRAGDHSLLVDHTTGEVSPLDVANLGVGEPEALPGEDVDLLPVGELLLVVDRAAGVVELQDPATLDALDTVEIGAKLTRAVLDAEGVAWVVDLDADVAVPLVVDGEELEPGDPVAIEAGDGAQLASVDGVPTLVDPASGTATAFGTGGVKDPVDLGLKAGEAPAVPRVAEGRLPLAANQAGDIVVVAGDDAERVSLSRAGHELGEPVTFDGRVYVADFSNGTIAVIERDGSITQAPVMVGDGGPFSLRVEGRRLWVDDPQGDDAYVIDRGGDTFRPIDKGRADVPSNDDPPADLGPPSAAPRPDPAPGPSSAATPDPSPQPGPPAPAGGPDPAGPPAPGGPQGPPAPGPSTPAPTIPPSPPGAPGVPEARPGDESAVVSWQQAPANGAPVGRYIIRWTDENGEEQDKGVPGDQLTTTIDGLDNGTSYTFRVAARNRIGTGPEASATPIVPDGEVPDAPTSVAATTAADGTVALQWEAADPNGPTAVASYDITASGDDGSSIPVRTGATTLTDTVGEAEGLALGVTYTFTVIATNTAGVVSEASEPSNAVVPYRPAGQVTGFAEGAGDKVLNPTWGEPALNGGTFASYHVVVTDGGGTVVLDERPTDPTVSVTGLANGTPYGITVTTITTVDGAEVEGDPVAGTGTPGGAPIPTGMTASANDRTLSWSVNIDENGSGPANCTLYVDGAVQQGPEPCSGTWSDSFTGGNGVTHTVYVRAENAYGGQDSNTASARTADPPSITAAKGRSMYDAATCWDPSCAYIRVTLSNYAPNTRIHIDCHETNEGNFTGYYVTTDGNGNSTSESCYYGYPGRQAWASAGGLTSNRVTW